MTLGWQVLPEVRIAQHKRDEEVLHKIRSVLQCGAVVKSHGDILELRVRGIEQLNHLVRFFKKHPLHTTKKRNFELFAQVIALMNEREHLTRNGLRKIALLAAKMNRRVTPKYLESSETACQTRFA